MPTMCTSGSVTGPTACPWRASDGATSVELHFIDEADAGNGEYDDDDDSAATARAALVDLQNTEREARLTALRLRELKAAGHQVWDPDLKAMRPVEWQDMVVLMRSPSSRVEAYAKEFFKCGVPLAAARDGFFEAIEITDLLSVLKLLDNPLQDVPLLAVLRSSLAGLSLDELADIRASFDDRPFWLALNKYHQRNARTEKSARGNGSPSTREKVAQFLQSFNYWRELARQGALSTCLERILLDTHYLALLQAEPRGEERVANVRRLLDLVREYDPWQRQGLYRFLRFVQQQQEAEVDFEPAFAQTSDAVRLMSVHGSKGLEFPVVALCNTASIFNQTDLRADVLLHSVYGVCPKVKPPETMASYPSVVHWLAKREEQRALWGEELRLLYVALTRARDTLLIIGSHKEPGWRDEAPAPVTDRALVSASSYFGWLKAWLPNVTEAADWTDDRSRRQWFAKVDYLLR